MLKCTHDDSKNIVSQEANMKRVLFILTLIALIVMTRPSPILSAPLAPEATTFVRVPAAAYNAADLHAVRAIDYDTFVWAEVMTGDLTRLRSTDLPYQVIADPFTLDLGGQRFDTRRGAPTLSAGWDAVGADGPDLHLVQFVGPTRDAWLDRLHRDGLEIVQYIHPFTYIVWGEIGARETAARADEVHWTGDFAPAYRVQPQWRNLPDEVVRVDVLLYRRADTETALRAIEALGGRRVDGGVLNDIFEIAGFDISGAQLQAAAQVPSVYSIQLEPTGGGLRGEMSNQVSVGNINGDGDAFPGYQAWLAAAGVDGSGVIIANVDNGVEETHTDLAGRMVSCAGSTCGGTTEPVNSHGTHTAGIMVADGTSGTTSNGFLRGLGMAPGANLVEQLYSPFYTDPDGMLLLMGESYDNGASISGNSWGPSGTAQGYDNDTMQVDIGVRDADPDTPGNQSLNYVLSIMNGYGGYQSQGTPDEAKNIFSLGSTYLRSGTYSIDDLSFNTAHGPALDGRTIPHMVAPGCSVDSTVLSDTHGLMCGTSMASPHVTGAAALFFQYHRALFGIDPSPAMVKAAFLPVAHDLAGNRDADENTLGHPFDYKQGWGRLNAAAVLSPTVPVMYFDNPTILTETGAEWSEQLSTADPGEPVRMMLVWTDAPGHGLGGTTPAWNNDLDLVVESGSATYYGNNFSGGWSQTGGSTDYRNNTEGVFLGPTPPVRFTVRVVASNINSDGIPNSGDGTDQDFALVCYNCQIPLEFTLTAEPEVIDVCAPGVTTATISVGETPTYTHPVTLSIPSTPDGITATVTPITIVPTETATLTVVVGAEVVENDYTLVISGTGEGGSTYADEVLLQVSTCPPAAPALLSPADGALGIPLEASFAWASSPQAQSYRLQVDTTPHFSAPTVDAHAITNTNYTLDSALVEGVCYFWRVAGDGACGEGEWAFPRHFSTAPAVVEQSPVVLAVTPRTGPVGLEMPIEITGQDFVSSPLARLGETWLLSTTRVSSTTIEAVVPLTLTPGSYDLVLVNGDCQRAVLTDAFLVFGDQVYLPLVLRE
jgi:hypothetical protein